MNWALYFFLNNKPIYKIFIFDKTLCQIAAIKKNNGIELIPTSLDNNMHTIYI